MLNQAIIAIALFQVYYWGINFFSVSILHETGYLLFNALFSLWLGMEGYRVRLGHEKGNSRTFGLFSRSFLLVSFFSIALGIFDTAILGGTVDLRIIDNNIVLGVLLMLTGMYLRHDAIKTLGKYFVTKVQVTDDHKLIREGIYRILRHPSYTGLIVGFTGALLILNSGMGLITFFMIGIPAYLYRIRIEEQALSEIFGNEYVDYKARSHANIPYIY